MENKTFEEKLKELEMIVRKLENKDISLDEAVSLYTKGVEMSKDCFTTLNEKEKLILEKMTDEGLVKLEEER